MFEKKNVLVAGGTGLVGQQIVPLLINNDANVFVASMDDESLVPKGSKDFFNKDLMDINNCVKATKNMDIVINLLGVTGSPKMNTERPASFMMSNLYLAINMLMAAQKSKVKNYLYTSTYGVYAPSKLMIEDDVWNTFPSEHDKYAGWAKRMGELQIDAFRKEYDFETLHIVRPANIYGPFGNFDPENSMVVSSLIRRFVNEENPLIVWGDGTAVRDFVYSKDVAINILNVMKKKIQTPINIGSGTGTSIKDLVNTIKKCNGINKETKIKFDLSKPSGDPIRILDMSKANKYGIKCETNLIDGLNETIHWYKTYNFSNKKRYNFFKNNK